MVEHQEHFGRKFYQDKKTGYWVSTDYPRTRAHRWVWLCIHKIIPNGYHIHHKDENKSNNSIENLELIEKSRHMSIHMQDEEKRKRASNMANTYRHLTKAWHSSEEGRAWHRLHAIRTGFGNKEPINYKCECCSKDFKSPNKSNVRFCSNNCKSKWRRDNGLDDIEVKCEYCNSNMMKNRYAKKTCCSTSCAAKLRWKKRTK